MIKAPIKAECDFHFSAQARMQIRSAVLKNDWKAVENFICDGGRIAMSKMSGNNYLDPKDFILTKGRTFECVCPYCQGEISLHLDEVDNG